MSKIIVLKTTFGIYRLYSKDVLYFEAANKEALVIWSDSGKDSLNLSISIGKCENLLEESLFFRIHRSYLVNRTHIFYFNFTESTLALYGGYILPVARNRRKLLAEWLLKENETFD